MKFIIAFLALGMMASGLALPSTSPGGMFPEVGDDVSSPDDVDITQIGDGY